VLLAATVLMVTVLAAAGALAAPPLPAEAEVTATFQAARDALAAGDGRGALAWLSRDSRNRIEQIRRVAANSGGALPASLGPSEKLAVLGLRRLVPARQLQHSAAPDLVGRMVSGGLVPPSRVAAAELGPVTVSGNQAGAPLRVQGLTLPIRLGFVRERGSWRVDAAPALKTTDTLLRLFAGGSGRSEEDYLSRLAERLPGGR